MRMVNVMETYTKPVKLTKDSVVPARAEIAAIELALLRLVDRLPEVEGVVRSPFLRADGSVCADVGYDMRSGNYLASTIHTNVPDMPSTADMRNAVALIDDMIHDFPLKSQADRAHVFALLLTPLVRHLVPLTPLFIMDGNGPGVGKNLLAESCMYVATGDWVQTDPLPTDSEEQRKQITALMSTGRSVALFDEAHIITGTSLARLITSTTWGDRLLGYSKQVSYPNRITVVALGNNVEVQGDMPRRSILVRLESQLARPYDRQDFRHGNLRDWVEEHRPELVGALLTLLVAWHQAGRPKGAARLGSFDAWAEIVGGALTHAGVQGFMSNVGEMRQRGAGDEQDMSAHLWELHSNFMSAGFTAKQIARMLEDDRLDSFPPRMGRDKNYAQALGHVYRHYSDRWMDGIRIRQDGVTHGARRWVLETMPVDNSPETGGLGGLGGLAPPTYESSWSDRGAADSAAEAETKSPKCPQGPPDRSQRPCHPTVARPHPRIRSLLTKGPPMPTPTPTPTGDEGWSPFMTAGVPIELAYRRDGRTISMRTTDWQIDPNEATTGNIRSTADGRLIETCHELAADLEPDDLPGQLDDRAAERVGKSYSLIDAALMSDAAYTIRTLAALLDGVMADDPQAIRDAALWLATNRPEGGEG
jgi:hypothetical protein